MKLKDYLDANEITPSAFADRIGVPASTVSRWVNGERTPRIDKILEVEAITGGDVPAEAWVSQPSPEQSESAA